MNRAGSLDQFVKYFRTRIRPFAERLRSERSPLPDGLAVRLMFPVMAFLAERGHVASIRPWAAFLWEAASQIKSDVFMHLSLMRHITTWSSIEPIGVPSGRLLKANADATASDVHHNFGLAQLRASTILNRTRDTCASVSRSDARELDGLLAAMQDVEKAADREASFKIAPATFARAAVARVEMLLHRCDHAAGNKDVDDAVEQLAVVLNCGRLPSDVFVVEGRLSVAARLRGVGLGDAERDYLGRLQKSRVSDAVRDEMLLTVKRLSDVVAA